MAKKPTAIDMKLLASIVAQTQANSFLFTADAASDPLVKAGLVEVNKAAGFVNSAGEAATRATQKGMEMVQKAAATAGTPANGGSATAAASAQASEFKIDTGIPVPTVKRGREGGTAVVYPFEALQPGQSFFIPATAERPNPAKSLTSTVSSAQRRYGTDTGKTRQRKAKNGEMKQIAVYEFTRRFVIRPVSKDTDPSKQDGARVWRVDGLPA